MDRFAVRPDIGVVAMSQNANHRQGRQRRLGVAGLIGPVAGRRLSAGQKLQALEVHLIDLLGHNPGGACVKLLRAPQRGRHDQRQRAYPNH